MPKEIFLAREKERSHSGIHITYYKTKRLFEIRGWYDSFVGIEGDTLTLKELLETFNITVKDCEKALKTE